MPARELRLFYAFRDSPLRRAALAAPPGSAERYSLFGLDQLAARGAHVRHNLEREGPAPAWARAADAALNGPLYGLGGYGGDFVSVLPSLRTIAAADVVLSTVDTVGLPLVLLKRGGLVRPPLVYVAIGLPERLAQLRGRRMRHLYTDALCRAHTVLAYSETEAERLRAWLGRDSPPVVFVPFGVDVHAFRPERGVEPDTDVVSVGADPRRDLALLTAVAASSPELGFRIVTTRDHARALGALPPNVALEADTPFEQARERLARARVVALPVRDNSYSGATTVLLQAMALGKPVVVSRTAAIASGYGLEDGVNCRLVPPGDADALGRALKELVADAGAAESIGTRARDTVERCFSWERYTDALWQVVVAAARARPSP